MEEFELPIGESRFVPVAGSTRVALEHYAQKRDQLCPLRLSEAFLVSERGKRLKASTARSIFVRMSRAVGLRSATEDGRDGYGPRPRTPGIASRLDGSSSGIVPVST